MKIGTFAEVMILTAVPVVFAIGFVLVVKGASHLFSWLTDNKYSGKKSGK